MPTEHSFIDIYSFTLLRVSFLLSIYIVELRLSTLNKPISDLISPQLECICCTEKLRIAAISKLSIVD